MSQRITGKRMLSSPPCTWFQHTTCAGLDSGVHLFKKGTMVDKRNAKRTGCILNTLGSSGSHPQYNIPLQHKIGFQRESGEMKMALQPLGLALLSTSCRALRCAIQCHLSSSCCPLSPAWPLLHAPSSILVPHHLRITTRADGAPNQDFIKWASVYAAVWFGWEPTDSYSTTLNSGFKTVGNKISIADGKLWQWSIEMTWVEITWCPLPLQINRDSTPFPMTRLRGLQAAPASASFCCSWSTGMACVSPGWFGARPEFLA